MEDNFEDEPTADDKLAQRVSKDFERAKSYLKGFHADCIDRHQHYVAPGLQTNLDADKTFPNPFITEQVDTLVSNMMEKLTYKDEPCSIIGHNDTDKEDADVKRQFMKYKDDVDGVQEKLRQAIKNCCIAKMAPAVVNYKEEFDMVPGTEEVQAEDEFGRPIMEMDGITPYMIEQPAMVKEYTFQGDTTELVDPIDFFWVPEKRFIYDEHPMMIRSRQTFDWFKKQPWILKAGLTKLKTETEPGGTDEVDDLLDERRDMQGFSTENRGGKEYVYVEWHGYIKGELYIIGVANSKVLMRKQEAKKIFNIGHPNIVIGNIGAEQGEIYGLSLIDKCHSVHHAIDTLLGMLLKSLRQTVNPMYKGDSTRLRNKNLENEAGKFWDCKGNPDEAIQRMEQEQISKDVYTLIGMFREMGQNATGISEGRLGNPDPGVDTLGEANIVEGNSAMREKGGYLRSFETSFVQPLYKMRNQINMNHVTDIGYLYSILENGVMHWRQIKPSAVKAGVDFICEASNRENQRAVITQQILQALNLNIKMGDILGPIPLLKLLEKLYEEGFGWKQETIKELLPMEDIAMQMQTSMLQQQQQGMAGENPQSMPQPKSEGQATANANQRNSTPVGGIG